MSEIKKVHLSVNVDHVATLRQARRVAYPDPVEAAALAENAGASGITVHLRGDRRHIQEADVVALRRSVRGKLNLEMAATEEMLAIARDLRPDQVTLVPERPEEVTTEGGLDLQGQETRIRQTADELQSVGIEVSVFIDPDPLQLDALERWGGGTITGFEINTDAYTSAGPESAGAELDKIVRVAARGPGLALRVYGGHGLTVANVGAVAAVAEMEELNIGHSIVSRAVLVGMETAVAEMLAAMRSG